MKLMNCNYRYFACVKYLGVGVAVFLFITGCNGKKEHSEVEKVIPVTVMNIQYVGYDVTQRHYVGLVEESSASSLNFQMMGVVEQVYVAQGQKVSQGQLLARLDKRQIESSYKAAVATLRQAQDAYDRMTVLYKKNSLPDIKYVEVQTSLAQAQSNEYAAKKNLDDCNLYAPHAGVIGSRDIEPGMTASPLQAAFKLIKVDHVKVKVSIPEKEIGAIKEGQKAKIVVTALQDEAFEGAISEKGVVANPLSHTYDVKINLANPGFKLLPGMVCKVFLDRKDGMAEYIVLPNRAVQVNPDGSHFVWIEGDGVAHRRTVTIGDLSINGVNIESGLSVDEKVIIDGYQKISEGMKVKIGKWE